MSIERFRIIQIGSPIRRHRNQRETLVGLCLNKIGRVAEVPNTRATWGMIAKVGHLVCVVNQEEYEEHRLRDLEPTDEGNDKRPVRNLILEPRRIRAKDIPESQKKTPDFELFAKGRLQTVRHWHFQTMS
jgi:large subunit ribosomal protein L30